MWLVEEDADAKDLRFCPDVVVFVAQPLPLSELIEAEVVVSVAVVVVVSVSWLSSFLDDRFFLIFFVTESSFGPFDNDDNISLRPLFKSFQTTFVPLAR